MNGYRPSPPMQAALDLFLHHLRDEPIPAQPGAPGDESLDPDFRKAVAMLRACSRQSETKKAMPPAPELMPSRFEPGMKEVRKVDLTELNMTEAGPGNDSPPEQPEEPPVAPGEQGGTQSPSIPPENAPILQKDDEPAVPVGPAPSMLAVRRNVTLRNARAGEDYSDTLLLEGASDLALSDSGGSGLVFDATDWTFAGVPAAAGDFELKLTGKIDGRRADITVKLVVIPDPKSLWTSLPSDRSASFWKPDEDFRFVATDHLRMFAASKRGRSHAKTGGFREDDFALAAYGPWHIAVVADGAGSARFSRRGSRLAVETVVAELPALLDRHLGDDFAPLLVANGEEPPSEIARRLYESLVTAAFKAADALAKDAEKLEEPVSSLSATLILAVARRLVDRWFVAAFSIGDGGAALLDLDSGQVQPLTVPDSGEYAGQTRFLARSEFADPAEMMKRLRYATPENFTALALMSDGITDPKLPTDNAFADPAVWASFWSEDLTKQVDFSGSEEDVKGQFLAWLDFWSPGNHDDRTLAVLLPRES